jgi:hypothetical protein
MAGTDQADRAALAKKRKLGANALTDRELAGAERARKATRKKKRKISATDIKAGGGKDIKAGELGSGAAQNALNKLKARTRQDKRFQEILSEGRKSTTRKR